MLRNDRDEEILRTIILFLLVTGYAMSAFIAIVFSHNLINPPTIRIVFVVMSVLGLVKVYAFLYRKCEVFGPRLRTTEYKLAVVNYSIQLFTFLFNYSMQYIIYIPMYKLAGQNITLDTVTIFISTFVVAVAGVMILLKGISLSCFEEDDDHWFKRMFFFGECCCGTYLKLKVLANIMRLKTKRQVGPPITPDFQVLDLYLSIPPKGSAKV